MDVILYVLRMGERGDAGGKVNALDVQKTWLLYYSGHTEIGMIKVRHAPHGGGALNYI